MTSLAYVSLISNCQQWNSNWDIVSQFESGRVGELLYITLPAFKKRNGHIYVTTSA